MTTPLLATAGDCYHFTWGEDMIAVEVDRLREESRSGLMGEITVRSSRQPNPGLLHRATFNLSSTAARRTLCKALEAREPDLDWSGMMEQLCYLTLERWRDGEPLIDLRGVDNTERPRWLLRPFLEYGGPTVLFADGGTGKSMFSLALAVSVASGYALVADAPTMRGPVLYLDWETDEYVHHERLTAIATGKDICLADAAPIYYRRESVALRQSAPALRKKVAELSVALVIVDSMGAARGEDPKDAGPTIATFNAARSLGCPVLFVDHVVKDRDQKPDKPFGSVYSANLARLTWGMVKAQTEGESRSTIVLSNHKSNNGRIWPRRGYYVDFVVGEDDTLYMAGFTPCDPRDIPEVAGSLSRREQIEAVLKANNTALTIDDIVTALEADNISISSDTVRAILNRHKSVFVQVMGKPAKWGLLAWREAAS